MLSRKRLRSLRRLRNLRIAPKFPNFPTHSKFSKFPNHSTLPNKEWCPLDTILIYSSSFVLTKRSEWGVVCLIIMRLSKA